MTDQELGILKARNRHMADRKVLCTGNPNRVGTIASGVREVFPNATFIHLSNGYDLLNLDASQESLEKLFNTHNTFINASCKKDAQIDLLDMCYEHMKLGDVFNIGSTNEYDGINSEEYKLMKLRLREKSLKHNSFRFQTCHVILGGIDLGRPDTAGWIKPKQIAELIKWTTEQKFKMPIISIDQPKRPW